MAMITQISIRLANGTNHGHDLATTEYDLDDLFKTLGHALHVGNCILDCDVFWAIEEVRTYLLSKFREQHGKRIKLDRPEKNNLSGDAVHASSASLALNYHMGLASGEWRQDLVDYIELSKAGPKLLISWRVLEVDVENVVSPNAYHLMLLEKARISFVALYTGSMQIWEGGVYHAAALLNDQGTVRRDACQYFRSVCRGLLALEQAYADMGDSEGWRDYDGEIASVVSMFVWRHGRLYREV